jgi:hypothetical protein
LSKKSISEIFNISDVTITKTYKKILPYTDIITNDELSNKYYYQMNLEYMSNNLSYDIDTTESDTLNTTESDTLNTTNDSDYLDESDIIKKDNIKDFEAINLQKEFKKLEKQKIKENKLLMKQQDKENNKLKKQNNKNIDTNIEKRKRGRPKKICTVVENII